MVRPVSDKSFIQNIANASKDLRGFVNKSGKKRNCIQTFFDKRRHRDHSSDLDTLCVRLTSYSISTPVLQKLNEEQKLNLLRKISKMEQSVFKIGKELTADQKLHVRAAQKMLVESLQANMDQVNARFTQACIPSPKKKKRDFEAERFEQLVSRAKHKDRTLGKISVTLDCHSSTQWIRAYEKLLYKQHKAVTKDANDSEVLVQFVKNALTYIEAGNLSSSSNIKKEHQNAVLDVLIDLAKKYKDDPIKLGLITTVDGFGNHVVSDFTFSSTPFTKLIDHGYLKTEFNLVSKFPTSETYIDDGSWKPGSQVWKIYDCGKPNYNPLTKSQAKQLIYSISEFNQTAFNGEAMGVPYVKDYIFEVLTRGYPQTRLDNGKHAEKNADMKVFLSYILYRISDPSCRNRQKFIDRIADAFAHSCPDVQYGTCQNIYDELTNASNLIGALNVQWQNHKYIVFSSLVQELHPYAGTASNAYDQLPHLENTYLTLVGDVLGLKGVPNARKDKNLNKTILSKYNNNAEKQKLIDRFRARMSIEEFAKAMQRDINNPIQDTPNKTVHIFEIDTINKWANDNKDFIPKEFKPNPITTQFGYYSDEKKSLYSEADGITEPMHENHELVIMPFMAMKELRFVMKMANLI